METRPSAIRSYLFTIRIWKEKLGDGRTEWRGVLQYQPGGEPHYFREWNALIDHLLEVLATLEKNEV